MTQYKGISVVLIEHDTPNHSRSQDFAKGGGGLFLKFDSTVNKLDPNFH